MSILGRTERIYVETAHTSYGKGKPVVNWVVANATNGMTQAEALAIAGDDEGNRVIREVTTRTIVPRPHIDQGNPHPCHQ